MAPVGHGPGRRVGGIGGLGILALALVAMFLGVDPSIILSGLPGGGGAGARGRCRAGRPAGRRPERPVRLGGAGADRGRLDRHLPAGGPDLPEAAAGAVRRAVESACGIAGSATGPFYCPADRKVYLDTSFFDELDQKFGAPGDFAQAYVIAHEVGHHVQTLLGISRQVTQLRQQQPTRPTANRLSVMMELQADCFAGVWARHTHDTQGMLEEGDIEEGLAAASAVGDDRIQEATRGYVVPDAFTHGSSEQRMRWFRQGLQTGDINTCDTFNAAQL